MTDKNSRFEQFIKYKALGFKFDDSGMILDAIIADGEDEKLPIRNVCAKVHVALAERLDNTVGMLRISKREFIEYAIIEALNRADEIMDEVDVMEFHREEEETEGKK